MTGIYDISGGEWERTASYVANGNENLLKYGKSVAYNGDTLKIESTKYTMVYPMTGIYDISGGTWERTASYVANGNENLLKYGKSVAYNVDTLKTESTIYTMVYPFDSILDNIGIANTEENLNKASAANYKKNTKIYGDAIREISTVETGTTAWNSDYSYFAGLYSPFVLRGGTLWSSSNAGSFYFDCSDGSSSYGVGFRPVVVPMS